MKFPFKLLSLLLLSFLNFDANAQHVITSDIDNFWKAYEKITSTQDSILQIKYLNEFYLNKGTPGLNAIRKARNYTDQDYLSAIHNYPKFWASVKSNTLKAKTIATELELGIAKFGKLYPELKPADIYFTIGALRTNGTFSDNLVLIGSEFAMADKNTITSEFPENIRMGRRAYFDSNPIENIVLLNIHEYVHTQQKPVAQNLLAYVVNEGVAEFVSEKVMGKPSVVPAVKYGKSNYEKVNAKFEQEMFYLNNQSKWLWSDAPNEFGVRDLGYYIGYQICENFYNKAIDKKEAVKKLIAIDYHNQTEFEAFVNGTNFFSKPVEKLKQEFEKTRPTVIGIKEFANNSVNVNSKTKEITIQFSEPLNGFNTGIDYGELGETAFPKNDVRKRHWAEDKKSWSIPVSLIPNKKYQLLITDNFRTKSSIPLKQYLIEFQTGE